MDLLGWSLLPLILIWAFERFYLRGSNIPVFPVPLESGAVKRFSREDGPGDEHLQVVKSVRELMFDINNCLQKPNINEAREAFDSISDNLTFASKFIACDADGVPAEWVIAPGADNNRRVLFIHGGGFVMGSPKSHRAITSRFSEVSGCVVLSIDYRLMPEFTHQHGVEDCQTAYHWILKNGPDGAQDIQQLFISGDSAGGNLTLSLLAWIRNEKLRAPEAAVVMSPLTDVTFSGESIHKNLNSDVMLKPVMQPISMVPSFFRSWWVWRTYGVRPSNPVVSPLKGDLAHLPPTLVQASEAEMLLDDARRYVFKANAAGSPAQLQTWDDMVHIWQIFYPQLPQAVEAWDEIGKFLQQNGAAHSVLDARQAPSKVFQNHQQDPGGSSPLNPAETT